MDGFYINLKHREDRNKHIIKLQNKHKFFKNIKQFDAIYDKQYGVGCSKSHIKCLELCLEMNNEYFLIMEDDLEIFDNHIFDEFVNHFEQIKNSNEWDVITLTPRGITKQQLYVEHFNRIVDTQTATAYIIKREFIKKLLPILRNGLIGLQQAKTKKDIHINFNDQCWKPIQHKTVWLYYYKIFAGQLSGYSDNEKRNTDYNKRFLEQLKF